MPHENSTDQNNLSMDSSNALLLPGSWQSTTKFDRLRDLSLLTGQ